MPNLPRVLLVDDDRNISRALALALRNEYAVDTAANGMQALYKTDSHHYHAIILDLNLPDVSGLKVCQQLRDRGIETPVLILSAETLVLTKINVLDAGANDYLTKPFSLGELKARLRVLLRQTSRVRPVVRELQVGNLVLDRQRHSVTRDGVPIPLRRKEFALLECLMEHAGTVVNRQMLIRHAWHGAEEPWTNTVDVHIKYLRDKLDRPFGDPIIQTVHGLGYRLVVTAPSLTSDRS